jgi:trans-aconitate methyltransferase
MSREWDATSYHRLSNPQFSWGLKVLERLKLRGDELILDAACGSGRLTAELCSRLPRGRVVGVDHSRNMLDQARRHLRLPLLQADLQHLPFRSVFDGIFSTAAFHWVPDHRQLFRSLFSVLRPGGWLDAQCGGGPNLERIHNRAHVIMDCPEYRPFFAGWTRSTHYEAPETFQDNMGRAGFVDVQIWLEAAPSRLPGEQDYKDFLATVTLREHSARITDPILRQRFVDELARRASQDDPPFTMDYWRLNMSARKP